MDETSKWTFPHNIGYDSFKIIINSLHNNNAETKTTTPTTLASSCSMNPKTVGPNLKFLQSIGVLEGNAKSGYRFTEKGVEFGSAISMDDEEKISSITADLIKNSHLDELTKFLDIHKNDLQTEKIYKFIASKAKIKMSSPYAAGAKALLAMFKEAKLLPDDFVIEQVKGHKIKKSSSKTLKKTGPKETKNNQKPTIQPTHVSDNEWYNFNLDQLSLSINKKIKTEDLEFSRSQIEQFIDHIKKKIESTDSEKDN